MERMNEWITYLFLIILSVLIICIDSQIKYIYVT